MPDPKGRTRYERELSRSVARALDRQRKHYRETGRLGVREFRKEFEDSVAIILAIIFLESADGLFREFDKPELSEGFGRYGRRWAATYSRELANSLVATSLDRIAEARRRGEEISPADLFGQERAETIGVTETTGAISAGERRAKRTLETALELQLRAFWQIEDLGACPVCRELNGRDIATLPSRFRNGPPAHPRCRCWLRYGP